LPVGAQVFNLRGRQRPGDGCCAPGRPARMDSLRECLQVPPPHGSVIWASAAAAAGAPIVVEGRVWGAAIVGSSRSEPLPPDTPRCGSPTSPTLVATADRQRPGPRGNLPRLPRARIVAAADDARRRFGTRSARRRPAAAGCHLGPSAAHRGGFGALRTASPLREADFPTSSMVWWAWSEEVQEISRGDSSRDPSCPRGDSVSALKTLARRAKKNGPRGARSRRRPTVCRSPPKWPPTYGRRRSTHGTARQARASLAGGPCAPKPRTPTSTSGSLTTGSGSRLSYGIWTHGSDRPRRSGRRKDGGPRGPPRKAGRHCSSRSRSIVQRGAVAVSG